MHERAQSSETSKKVKETTEKNQINIKKFIEKQSFLHKDMNAEDTLS